MLYLIGLGLADEKDISVRGLEIVRKAERVYLEAYTAVLLVDQAKLVLKLNFAFDPPLLSTFAVKPKVLFAISSYHGAGMLLRYFKKHLVRYSVRI